MMDDTPRDPLKGQDNKVLSFLEDCEIFINLLKPFIFIQKSNKCSLDEKELEW